MRAHSDPIALENSFLSVLRANSSSDNTALVGLKKHCLEPGIYHLHIQRWLEYCNYHQVEREVWHTRACMVQYGAHCLHECIVFVVFLVSASNFNCTQYHTITNPVL